MELSASAVRPAGRGEGAPGVEQLRAWTECYGEELRAHLGRMLASAADAEDVLQEVWITASTRPPELGPESNARAWLYRVATNAALSRLAVERRRRAALQSRGDRLRPDALPAPDAALQGADEGTRRRVREAVARLPSKQRRAVWMRWAKERDYESIARALGCSPESARANVYQAMKRLRTELFDLEEDTGR